jgi:hypothetical protein
MEESLQLLQALLDHPVFETSHFDTAESVRPPREKPGRERRAATRHSEDRLHWVRIARLQFGHGVSLVDLSTSGARLDSPVALRPSFVSSLEIIGAGLETVVPFRVLRCEVGGLTAEGVIYRGACEFMRPIEIPNIARLAVQPAQPAQPDDVLELDVVLKNLVRRAGGEGGIQRFSDPQLVQALKALHLRAANVFSDPMGQRLQALLRLVLPAVEQGGRLTAVLQGIETQLCRVVPGAAVRFVGATTGGGGPTQNSILIGAPGVPVAGPLVRIDVPKRLTMTAWQHRVTMATSRVIALLQRLEPDRSIDVSRAVTQPEATPAPIPESAAPAMAAEEVARDADAPAVLPTGPATAGTAWQKVVVRYSEGQILKGYTQDFHASRPHFTLFSAPSPTADGAVIVPLVRLKAVFFVRDFAGNPGYVECNEMAESQHGRRIEVTLNDEEIIVGTTLNYRSSGQGFFVTPIDPLANNIRVFVVAQSVRQVRFPIRPPATV